MPITILIGAQWGDEGKGRFVDHYAAHADIVARYAGGDNAGHTVAVGDTVYKMHLIPSGILHDGVVAVLGNGMVVNPVNLVAEMDTLIAMGVSVTPDNLILSNRAHIITPAHIALDKAKEIARGDAALGTTLRGIGPAYLDKTGRSGIRAERMVDVEEFAEVLRARLQATNARLQRDGFETINLDETTEAYIDAAARLRPYIQDTSVYLYKRLRENALVIAEGAQGTLLDVDHGSYPFVTSSSPTAGGALTGLGVGPKFVDRVIGVAKAFSTRVGGGPMPTELDGELADRLRGTGDNYWDEYGTTTGRPRRTGWLDGVMLRYACAINGFTELVLTKMDILTGFDELQVAVAYDIDGQRYEYPPSDVTLLERAVPIYEVFEGWHEDVGDARSVDALPAAARRYVAFIAEMCDTPIERISVGPERSQVVELV